MQQNGIAPGSAYVFERDAGGSGNWGQVDKIYASTIGPDNAKFAALVVHSGDIIVANKSNADGVFVFQVNGTPPVTYDLTVNKTGKGRGTVTSNPLGVNCGSNCTVSFIEGKTITLTAKASAGSTFSSWSGCTSVSANVCIVSMTKNQTVTASFIPSVKSSFSFNPIDNIDTLDITVVLSKILENPLKRAIPITISRDSDFRKTVSLSSKSLDGNHFRMVIGDNTLSSSQTSTTLILTFNDEDIQVGTYRVRITGSASGLSDQSTIFNINVTEVEQPQSNKSINAAESNIKTQSCTRYSGFDYLSANSDSLNLFVSLGFPESAGIHTVRQEYTGFKEPQMLFLKYHKSRKELILGSGNYSIGARDPITGEMVASLNISPSEVDDVLLVFGLSSKTRFSPKGQPMIEHGCNTQPTKMLWPMKGVFDKSRITQGHGVPWSTKSVDCDGERKLHVGIDYGSTSVGDIVKAAFSGEVVSYVDNGRWADNLVVENDAGDMTATYLHIDTSFRLKDSVTRGEIIGTIADIRDDDGVLIDHLHFALRNDRFAPPARRGGLGPSTRCVTLNNQDAAYPEKFIDPAKLTYDSW